MHSKIRLRNGLVEWAYGEVCYTPFFVTRVENTAVIKRQCSLNFQLLHITLAGGSAREISASVNWRTSPRFNAGSDHYNN